MRIKSKLAVIGAGKMGYTLIRALLDSKLLKKTQIVATTRHSQSRNRVSKNLGVHVARSNCDAVRESGIVLVCVKPQVLQEVIEEIRPVVTMEHLIVSTVASASTELIEKTLGEEAIVVRSMPNTPCLIRAGMTALCGGRKALGKHLEQAREIFQAVGRTVILDEKHMDAVTALSASGPAYIYVVLESLAEGGVKVGLPRDMATELAGQMCLGAAKMVLETQKHPALLKDAVTTPAGCTIDGLLKLEEGGLRVTLIKAVVEATRRANQLLAS